jgi:diguanylate cyclase (GGDEF)-like protein/PAS domain S-box-containing protein
MKIILVYKYLLLASLPIAFIIVLSIASFNQAESTVVHSQRVSQMIELNAVKDKYRESLLKELKVLQNNAQNHSTASVVYGILAVSLLLFLFWVLLIKVKVQKKHKKAFQQQAEMLHKFKLIVENAVNAVIITNKKGNIEYVNKSFTTMTGYKPEQVIGQSPQMCNAGNIPFDSYEKLYTSLAKDHYWRGELQNKRKNGELYWIKATIFPVNSLKDNIAHYIGIQEDITEQKRDKEVIEHLANHDELTGLPSLRLGKDRLEQAILAAQRHKLSAAMMYIDLDGFKQINDEFGHSAGDEVLKVISNRMIQELRNTDTVARVGGDEFIIIMTNIKDDNVIASIAQKIINAVKEPVHYNYKALHVTASIGIAVCPVDSILRDDLIKKADSTMYIVKKSGKNNYGFYSEIKK